MPASSRRVPGELSIPAFLWVSTLVLAASSAPLEAAKYALCRAKIAAIVIDFGLYRPGLTFLVLQASSAMDSLGKGWRRNQPHGSAFYVFT
jgi:heme/copper-type cytochrome/quinol oxidase subunit 3